MPNVSVNIILTPITVEFTVTSPAMLKLVMVDIIFKLLVRLRMDENVVLSAICKKPLQISEPVPAMVVVYVRSSEDD
ncbi:hypothetical protein GCM10022210_23510 [Mucilaginibacter dorajii]|uniref:Uncharacterized protein n=1 Tax=Mucilaginibacter dorajii TaxID=692994 RepID=A0ABP7PX00_9SPHI